MEQTKLCVSDFKFMSVVWDNEPVQSGDLVKVCLDTLGWKKSTTYTMVKKMADKGYLKNENSVVTSCVSRKEAESFESHFVIENTFEGSLPAFIAAFMQDRSISDEEAEQIRKLIDQKMGDK